MMQMFKQLILYSTSHCHLCELAHALVLKVSDGIALKVIDIADDDVLLSRYDVRIPVLQRNDTKAELNWPFDETDIHQFLK